MAAIGLVVVVAYRKGAPDKPLARVIPVSEAEATRKKAIRCGLYERVLLANVFMDHAPK